MFLRAMPKGGDLHNHLSGGIYAEDYLGWARDAGFCATADGRSITPPPCPAQQSLGILHGQESDADDRLVDALSTRGYQQGIGRDERSGHAQFFQSFARFAPVERGSAGKMLAAARRQAAFDRLIYLETDHDTDILASYAFEAGDEPLEAAGLAGRYDREVGNFAPLLARASDELTREEAEGRRILGCDGADPDPGCGVTVRYLFQAFRDLPPAQVFRSLILGFAMVERDSRFVGINLVMPEDSVTALRDYNLHMAMVRFLHAKYPKVRITLHAGELTLGLVPPKDLRDHIAKAVAAGAERIGHGVDIAFEEDAARTMARMARNGIAVEVNLTSNDVILGVKGDQHPINLYRRYGVPVVLGTDDPGVLRTDMTQEFWRAAREQGFGYRDLKDVARASLEYAFLPGMSLWQSHRMDRLAPECADGLTSPMCRDLLSHSEKARLEADLEQRFTQFEQDRIAVAGSALPARPAG